MKEPSNDFMTDLASRLQEQGNACLEAALQTGIDKGFIKVRQSKPCLIRESGDASDKIKLAQSVVIDYLGAERIDELEKENAYLKKLNSDLHKALSEFYEKAKPNQWLKNE